MDDGRSIAEIRTATGGDFGPLVKVRKFVTHVEEIMHEFGPPADRPWVKGFIAAVTANPYAGTYVEDLMPMMDALKPLGVAMSERLIAAMGGVENIHGYGKSALVGENGELEHAAMWHVPGGYAMRELIQPSKAIVPSSMKVAGPGRPVDVPLGHVNAAYVRSYFDSIECSIPDAPRANEIVWILAMMTGPRINNRAGGLQEEDVVGEDGNR